MNKPLIHLDIDRSALAHNVQVFRKLAGPETIFTAGVKANAFGHGLIPTSKTFLENGANWLFVNSIEEAEQLEGAEITAPILIAGYLQKDDLKRFAKLRNARLIVYNEEAIKVLNEFEKNILVHVMIDTGMHREGVALKEAQTFLETCTHYKNIIIEGLCTHFAGADEIGLIPHFNYQLKKFDRCYDEITEKTQLKPIKHCASSGAFLLHTHETRCNMIRPAASLYGIYPNEESRKDFELREAMSLKTKIAQIKWVEKNGFVGYGCTYQAKKRIKVALLPVGYNEGIDRRLGNIGQVLIGAKKCPIIGKISMHMTTVDITAVDDAKLEDEVVLFGKQGDESISIAMWAEWLKTNPHEIMTGIPQHIPRKYLKV